MSAFTEANRQAFNDLSATYNAKAWQHNLSQQVSDALQHRRDWLGVRWAKGDDGRDVSLLDYACGTGAITKALGPYVTTIRGVDISEKMVELYNEAARSSGLEPERANAVVGDLLAETIPEQLSGPDYEQFDVAVIGLGFHHFEDPALAIKHFLPFKSEAQQEPKDGEHPPHGAGAPDMTHTIKHNGFTRSRMEKLYEQGGLEDFGWYVDPKPVLMEMKTGTKERTLFIAKGRRAPTAWGKLRNWFFSVQLQTAGQMSPRPDTRYS
ncbi:hypothetical protein LTR53_003009 [Teratosphaeriaceae sp. CCFEE 6253]|nr:hypothetical protein LTR53_003009 [Teratosphaeriaceae sp. CCFEE 6253]